MDIRKTEIMHVKHQGQVCHSKDLEEYSVLISLYFSLTLSYQSDAFGLVIYALL